MRGASEKFKNQPRPLLRPRSVNFCQHFRNLSPKTVLLIDWNTISSFQSNPWSLVNPVLQTWPEPGQKMSNRSASDMIPNPKPGRWPHFYNIGYASRYHVLSISDSCFSFRIGLTLLQYFRILISTFQSMRIRALYTVEKFKNSSKATPIFFSAETFLVCLEIWWWNYQRRRNANVPGPWHCHQ